MDKTVIAFIQALRHHGLAISPTETLDAVQAVNLIGVANRERLKNCLSISLAKNLTHQGLLNNLFDQFFNSPECHVKITNDAHSQSEWIADAHHVTSELGQLLLEGQKAALHQNLKTAAEQAGAQSMTIFLQKNRISAKIMQALGDRELQEEIQALSQEGQHLALVADLQKKRQHWLDTVKDYVEQQYLLYSGKRGQQLSEETLHKVKLNHLDHLQQRQIAALIQKIAKKLASLHSRRRRITQRGLLDTRKTIAANAAYDGFLIHTRWKSTRKDRPKVIVICDVSGSVAAVARLFLLFVYSLQSVLPRVRSFVFSNELVEVTNALQTENSTSVLDTILDRWSNYATDYGQTLQDFNDSVLKHVDHNTHVIMLGDARNNHDNGRAEIWQAVYLRAKRTLWLNPEESSRWDTGDSIMSEYAPYCSLIESCNSLRDMERVLGRLLKYA